MILQPYACFFSLCLIYNFSFVQRLEVDVNQHVYIHTVIILI